MGEEIIKQEAEGVRARVMLVDDEECIRETVSALLNSEGLAVITADGADECLRLLKDGFRGVILMDVMMPGMDGWSTIRKIEQAGLMRGNIISMLTASGIPGEMMDGLQEVVIDYINKPFEANCFVAAVRKYLALLEQLETGS